MASDPFSGLPSTPSHDLNCWLECPDGGCNLTALGGDVFLPGSYTFYLATPLLNSGHVGPWDDGAGVSVGTMGQRKFGLMHLDVSIGYDTAGWPDDPLEDLEPGTWIGANDGFGEGKPTEDWEDDSPCHGSGDYPVIKTGVTHLLIDLALIEGINKDDLCGDLYERLGLTLRTTNESVARILTVDPYGLWEKVAATDPIDDFHFKLYPLDERGKWVGWQFYLEGVRPGTVFVELTGIIDGDSYRERIDRILVHIAKIDVDVDSDNTKTEAPFGPDGSIEEDRIEDRDDLPGRIVLVNDDDDDNDGVIDYGDGYNLNPDDFVFEDNNNTSEDDFIEMKLSVPAPVDLTAARIRVTYEASNPDSATYDYGDPPEVPPISITPAAGLLRIWSERGDQSRRPGVDYVAPGTHPASDFGLSNGTREVSLWLEGISPGQAQVVFEVDPDGDGPADFVHSDAFRVTVLKVAIVNPTGPSWVYDSSMGQKTPRIMTPANAPFFGGNEFTYSAAYPNGVLTVPVHIQIEPDTAQIRTLFENKIRTRVSAVNDSHLAGTNVQLTWDHPFPGEPTAGNAMYRDPWPNLPFWQATATFTKLPPDNEDFGLKTLTVDFLGTAGNIVCSPRTRDYEIFYPIEATNHPDLPGIDDLDNFSATIIDTAGHGNSTRSQNWFFYWNRTPAGDANARFYSDYANWMGITYACVPAGTHWSTYTGPRERTVFDPSGSRGHDIRQDGSGLPISGIDLFANVVLHENRHVLQKLEHDALIPYNVSLNGARVGYSWCANGTTYLERTRANIQNGLYNHFGAGGDMSPGWADHDDDKDQEWDELDEFIAGPGDTVVGDDEDLDPDDDFVSHLVPTDPDPDPTIRDGELTEKQANAREISPQDTFREHDWGSPGKQHGPDLATPNNRLEMNRYDD